MVPSVRKDTHSCTMGAMRNRLSLALFGLVVLVAPVLGQTSPTTPTPANAQTAPAKPQGNPATVHDFFVFTRALRPLKTGQLSSQLTMDIVGEGLKLKVRADVTQTYSATGRFMAETSVWPPSATAPKHYKIYFDGKVHTINEVEAKTYATSTGTVADDFFVRGMMVNFVREALAKVPADVMKMLDAKELTPEVTAALKEKIGEGDGAMFVRDETVEGKAYKVYEIQASSKKPDERVAVFINATTDLPELLQFKGKENNLEISVTEKVIKTNPKVPADMSYRFVRRKGMKKVTKIEIGGF